MGISCYKNKINSKYRSLYYQKTSFENNHSLILMYNLIISIVFANLLLCLKNTNMDLDHLSSVFIINVTKRNRVSW